MKQASVHVLRVGIAITFLWIGILIFQNPQAWGGYILPWAEDLLIADIRTTMIFTALFDIVIGFCLLVNYFTFWACVLASLHLILVLIVAGINPITVRDIGLLAGTFALALSSFPYGFDDKQPHS